MPSRFELSAVVTGENRSSAAFTEAAADARAYGAVLDDLDGRRVDVPISVDGLGVARAQVQGFDDDLTKLDARRATATVDVDSASARAEVLAFESEIKRLGSLKPTIKLDFDGGGAMSEMAALRAGAASLGSLKPTIKVDLDGGGASSGMAALRAQAASLGSLSPTIKADFDGAGASAGMAGLTAQAVALGALSPTVDVDVDTAGATAQLAAFQGGVVATTAATQGLTNSMTGGGVLGAGSASPAVLVGALGLIGVVGAGALAALGPLAAGIATVGVAGVAAAAGVGLLAAAFVGPIMQIKAFTEAQKEQGEAQKEAAATAKTYAAAQERVQEAERGVADAQRARTQAVGDAEAKLRDVREQGVADVRSAEAALAETRRAGTEGIKSAEQTLGDTRRRSAEQTEDAEKALQDARAQGTEDISDAEVNLRDTREQGAEDVRSAEASLTETRRTGAESVKSAEQNLADVRLRGAKSAEDAEDAVADARQRASEQVASAEDSLASARSDLESATTDLVSAQEDLNRVLRDEPLNQRDATRDLASARLDAADAADRESDALKELNKLRRTGTPEEITDAERDYERAKIANSQATDDLTRSERETGEIRKQGSSELQAASKAEDAAYKNRLSSAGAVKKAEADLAKARAEGTGDVQEALENLADARAEAARDESRAANDLLKARQDRDRQTAEAAKAVAKAEQTAAKNSAAAASDLAKARKESAAAIRDAEEKLKDSRVAGARDEKRAQDALLKARQDRARGTAQAAKEVQRAEESAAKNVAAANQELARTRSDASRRIADAERVAAKATRDAADAAAEMRKAQEKAAAGGGILTAANRKLLDSYKALKPAYKEAFAGANKEAAEFGAYILGLTKSTFPALGRESKQVVSEMGRQFRALGDEMGPQEKRSLLSILDSTSDILGGLVRASGRFGGALANTFKIALPFAEDFVGWLEDMGEKYLDFTRSAEGKKSIKEFFQSAVPVVKELAEKTGKLMGFIVEFGKTHGPALAKAIDLIGDSMEAWFGKDQVKDAEKAGTAAGKGYSGHFAEAAKAHAKKEGPGIGERWGEAIGKGVGNLWQWILDADKRNNSGEPAGKGFATGFLKGLRDAFSDYDFSKSKLADLLDFGDWKDSKLYELLQKAQGGLDSFGDWIEKWGGRIEDFLIDPFSKAYDKIVGKSIVPDMKKDVVRILGDMVPDVGKALKGLPGEVGDAFSGAYKKAKGHLDDLKDSAKETMGDASKSIRDKLQDGAEWGKDALRDLDDKGTKSNKNLASSADKHMGDAAKWIRENLGKGRKDGVFELDELDVKGTKSQKDLASSADKHMGDAEKWIRDHLGKGRKDGVSELGVLRDKGSTSQKDLEKSSSESMKTAKENAVRFLENAREMGVDALGVLRDKGSKSQKDLEKSSSNSMQTAKENAVRSLENAREMGVSALGVLRDKGGDAMKDARDKFREPVGTASSDMQSYMNNMLYGMGMVIEKADLDLKKPEKFPINSGTSDPTGREEGMNGRFGMAEGGILHFAGGGSYAGAPAIGPEGGVARGGAVRVFGEVPGSTEYYINPDAPNDAARMRQPGILDEAAGALNRAVVPLGGAWDQDEREKAQRTLSMSARSLGGVYIPTEAIGNTAHAVNETLYNQGVFHYWGKDPESGDLHEMHEMAEGGKYTGAGFYGVENWQGGFGTSYGATGLNGAPHLAVDIPAPEGSPIHAIFAGQSYSEPGNQTPHDNATDYGELSARYGHHSRIGKTGGVSAGDVIGYIGSLGLATGPHTHISVAPTISQMESTWNGDRHPDELFGRSSAGSGSFTGPTGGGGGTDKKLLELKSMPTSGDSQPHVNQVRAFMDQVFPDILEIGGLRPGDPQDHGKGLALDYMTSAHGTTGPPGSPLQDKISQYIQQRWDNLATSYIIDKQRIDFGGGFEPMDNRGSITENHMDHVHQSFMPTPGAKFGTTALVGGTTVDIMPIIDKYIKKVPDFGKGLPPESAEKIAGAAREAVVDKLMSSAPSASTSGVSSGPMSGDQKDTAEWMAKEAVKRKIPDVLPVMTSLVESELKNLNYGHSSSLGLFQMLDIHGTAEQRTDPAFALNWFLDNAEATRRKVSWQDAGALGVWAQDVQRSAHPERYAERYGDARGLVGPVGAGGEHGPTPKGYELGGRIPGVPGELKNLMAHAGEIVLPRGVSDAFLAHADALKEDAKSKPARMSGRYGTHMSAGASSGQDRDTARALSKMADKLEKMGRRLEESARDDADRLVETLERLGVEIPEGVREGVITNLEKGRRTGDAMKKGLKRADKVLAATGARFDVEDY